MWKEYYSYNTTFTSLPAGNGSVFVPNEMRIDSDTDFEFQKTSFQPKTARVRLKYRDDTNGRYLMKGSMDCRSIGGTSINSMAPATPREAVGILPFIWPRPYIISAATSFTVEASEFSGNIITLYLAFHGAKIREGVAPWEKQYRAAVPYIYSLNASGFVTIGANSTTSASIVTDKDAPFVIHKITGSRTGGALVSIKDGARDRQWMNTDMHIDNLMGNGQYPNVLSAPRFIEKASVISVSLQDLSGASNIVEMNFIGVKLYA